MKIIGAQYTKKVERIEKMAKRITEINRKSTDLVAERQNIKRKLIDAIVDLPNIDPSLHKQIMMYL